MVRWNQQMPLPFAVRKEWVKLQGALSSRLLRRGSSRKTQKYTLRVLGYVLNGRVYSGHDLTLFAGCSRSMG